MYRQFLSEVRGAVGYEHAEGVLAIGGALAVLAVLILLTCGRGAEARVRPGWRRFLAKLVLNSLRGALGLAVVGVLSAMLLVQAGLFTERHGQVTQRNYQAVRSKWGVPHEQRPLRVTHFTWQRITVEEFAGGGRRRVVEPVETLPPAGAPETETLSDETFPVDLDEEGRPRNPRQIARRVVTRERQSAAHGRIETADIDLTVTSNPRMLGGAAYAGFEDEARFRYTVANPSRRRTRAVFRFPLPGKGQGLFNRLTVLVDGRPLGGALDYADSALVWRDEMEPGARVTVEIAYASRGLEYIRYWPGTLRRRCRVNLRLVGVPPERLNFPIGSMSPDDDLAKLEGTDYTLHWDLSNAVTNYSIGVIVPAPRQPGFEVARILHDAPPGLALMALAILAARLLLGTEAAMVGILLSAGAHYLGYALFTHLAEHVETFAAALLGGMAIPALGGAVFWWMRDRGAPSGRHAGGLHLLFTLGYPLAVSAEDWSGTLLNAAGVALVLYLMALAAARRFARPAPAGEEG